MTSSVKYRETKAREDLGVVSKLKINRPLYLGCHEVILTDHRHSTTANPINMITRLHVLFPE